MILVVCKSELLAQDILHLAEEDNQQALCLSLSSSQNLTDLISVIKNYLLTNTINIVFFDAACFLDPGPFKILSPLTNFVFIAGMGEEYNVKKALMYGVSAIVNKPLQLGELTEVISLVSQ